MRLRELGNKATSRQINKLNESKFGVRVDYNKMTVGKAQRLSRNLSESLDMLRKNYGIHTAEKNPKYMELLMVREGLNRWIEERVQLTESEMGKSEAILAAKDIVDSIQDMIEDAGKMQNEQLPALIDTIRDQIGSEQGDQYKNAMASVMSELLQQLGSVREAADNAVRALTGESTPQPMSMGDDEPTDEFGDHGMEHDFDDEEPDGFDAMDAAAGGADDLGRERR